MKNTGKTLKSLRWIAVVIIGALLICLNLATGTRGRPTSGFKSRGATPDDRPTDPGITKNTAELVSYQDRREYRFLVIPPDATPPSGFERPGFNDSAFSTGSAAFGGGGRGAGVGDCPLRSTVKTAWPLETQLLVRREVFIPTGSTGVRVMVAVDNDIVGVFFSDLDGVGVDGTPISGLVSHGDCPVLDEFRFDVPQELVRPGENHLIAFHVRDRGADPGGFNESFFDIKILAESSLDSIVEALARPIAFGLPVTAATNITVECPRNNDLPRTPPEQTTINFLVAATGEEGRIIIDNQDPNAISTRYFLGGELMVSGRGSLEEHSVRRTPAYASRLSNGDPGILATEGVLLNKTVREKLVTTCFRRNLASFQDREECLRECSADCEKAKAKTEFTTIIITTTSTIGGAVITIFGGVFIGPAITVLNQIYGVVSSYTDKFGDEKELCTRDCQEKCPKAFCKCDCRSVTTGQTSPTPACRELTPAESSCDDFVGRTCVFEDPDTVTSEGELVNCRRVPVADCTVFRDAQP